MRTNCELQTGGRSTGTQAEFDPSSGLLVHVSQCLAPTEDSGMDFAPWTLDANNLVSNKSFIKEVQYSAVSTELLKVDNEL